MGFRGVYDLGKRVQQKFTDKPRLNNVKNSSKVVGVFKLQLKERNLKDMSHHSEMCIKQVK